MIPRSLQQDMKRKVHASHMGVESSLRRARERIFWPGMSGEIKQLIESCETCRQYETNPQKETLIPHEVPSRPWEKVGTDLFKLDGKDYLVTFNYYSNFIEVDGLQDTRSGAVILKLKSHFARYGCPNQVVSDNGPKYSSEKFAQCAEEWEFEHLLCSPGNSKANSKAECTVKNRRQIRI